MRLVLLVLALWSGAAHAVDKAWGVHGMVLFGGREGLYASHLPLFHPPHDYQVILRVHAADEKLDRALRAKLDGQAALWTIEPEQFDLARLASAAEQPLRAFQANIVEGHFEQGGTTRWRAAQLVVDQVLLFHRLSPAAHESGDARYVQVGEGRQRFLVKTVDSRPDFDHIVAYRAAPGASTDSITVPKVALKQPAARTLADALGVPPASVGRTIWFYTDDLR